MSSLNKVIYFIAIAALVIALSTQDVSAKKSSPSQDSITTPQLDTTKIEISSDTDDMISTESPTIIEETDPSSSVTEEPIRVEEVDYKTSECKCSKASKDGLKKSKAQDIGEKDGSDIKTVKKSGKKFRVITITLPVEPESVDSTEVVEEDSESHKETKQPEIQKVGGDEESEEITPTTPSNLEEEEVVAVTKSKKQVTLKTKSEKKRSKRETKRKVNKEKESSSKSKKEKKSKKGKNKK